MNERKRLDKDIKRNESMKKEVEQQKPETENGNVKSMKRTKRPAPAGCTEAPARELRNTQNEITGRESHETKGSYIYGEGNFVS